MARSARAWADGSGGASESALAASVGTPALDGLGFVGANQHTDRETMDADQRGAAALSADAPLDGYRRRAARKAALARLRRRDQLAFQGSKYSSARRTMMVNTTPISDKARIGTNMAAVSYWLPYFMIRAPRPPTAV